MNKNKALRGLWGANRGPKMPREKRQARKIVMANQEAENSSTPKGWKAHR